MVRLPPSALPQTFPIGDVLTLLSPPSLSLLPPSKGRLAMIGTAGMIVQELVNGKGVLENLGLEKALPAAFDTAAF